MTEADWEAIGKRLFGGDPINGSQPMSDREAAEIALEIAEPAAAQIRAEMGPCSLDHLGIRADHDEVLVAFSKTGVIVFNPLLAVAAALAILEAVVPAAKAVTR